MNNDPIVYGRENQTVVATLPNGFVVTEEKIKAIFQAVQDCARALTADEVKSLLRNLGLDD
jgi:hypothetical protein